MMPWIAWNMIEFKKNLIQKLKIGARLGLNHLMTQIQNKAPHGKKKNITVLYSFIKNAFMTHQSDYIA